MRNNKSKVLFEVFEAINPYSNKAIYSQVLESEVNNYLPEGLSWQDLNQQEKDEIISTFSIRDRF